MLHDVCTALLYMILQETQRVHPKTYTRAWANFAALCDEVTANREVVIIQRRGAEDVALVAAQELDGLLETAHLLRSPANAERLLTALARAQRRALSPQSLDALRRSTGSGTGG